MWKQEQEETEQFSQGVLVVNRQEHWPLAERRMTLRLRTRE